MTTGDGDPDPVPPEPETPDRPLARLLGVQDHDTVIDQLRHRRATLPERAELATIDRQLGALEVRTKEVRSARDELGDRQAALEQQIEASRTRRATLEKRLFGGQIVASRELQAMNEEVKHLARHISELEDREIEVMEALEPLDRELQAGDVTRARLDDDAERLRGPSPRPKLRSMPSSPTESQARAARHRECPAIFWPATSSCARSSAAPGRLVSWAARVADATWRCRRWSSTACAGRS